MKSTGDKNNCLYKDVILFAGTPNINHEEITYQQETKKQQAIKKHQAAKDKEETNRQKNRIEQNGKEML